MDKQNSLPFTTLRDTLYPGQCSGYFQGQNDRKTYDLTIKRIDHPRARVPSMVKTINMGVTLANPLIQPGMIETKKSLVK